MKVLWITDIHINEDKPKLMGDVLDFFYDLAISRKVDGIINTGDTHHGKNQLFATELDMYRKFLERITPQMPVWTIVGNHDWAHPHNYSIHSLESVRAIPNHTVVDSSLVIEDKGQRIGLMAYCWTKGRFEELRSKMGHLDRMFGHYDMNDFYLSGGHEEVGSWFADEMFTDLKQVYSGHYHTHQQKKIKNTLVTFLGTAYTTNAGEANQEKRVAIVDLVTGEIEFIVTPFTMHKKVSINVGDVIPQLSAEDANKGVDLRWEVVGTTEQIRAFLKDKKLSKEVRGRIQPKFIDKKEKRLDISIDSTTEEKVRMYVTHMLIQRYGSVEKAPVDLERLVKMGLNLTNES